MPWQNSLKSPISTPDTSPTKTQQPPISTTDTTSVTNQSTSQQHSKSPKNTRTNAKTIHKNSQQPKLPTKRKTRSSFHVNKLQKLSDIATDALAAANSENNSDNPN